MPPTPIISAVQSRAVSIEWSDIDEVSGRSLADILRREGVDLGKDAKATLHPGTPVYVHSEADVSRILPRLARSNCRIVPVLENGSLVGLIDLADAKARVRRT